MTTQIFVFFQKDLHPPRYVHSKEVIKLNTRQKKMFPCSLIAINKDLRTYKISHCVKHDVVNKNSEKRKMCSREVESTARKCMHNQKFIK